MPPPKLQSWLESDTLWWPSSRETGDQGACLFRVSSHPNSSKHQTRTQGTLQLCPIHLAAVLLLHSPLKSHSCDFQVSGLDRGRHQGDETKHSTQWEVVSWSAGNSTQIYQKFNHLTYTSSYIYILLHTFSCCLLKSSFKDLGMMVTDVFNNWNEHIWGKILNSKL